MTDDVVVVGAGGHASVVVDLLLDRGFAVPAMIGRAPSTPYRGVPVLVGDDQLAALHRSCEHCLIAVGDNALRRRLADEALALGFELTTVVARGAQVSPSAHLGSGTVVMNGAVINASAHVGDLAIINTGATVDHDCVIGSGSHVAPGCTLAGNVQLGEGVFLGAGTIVIPGVRIGAGASSGAGSVITTDVAAGVHVRGVPARPAPESMDD